MSFNPKNRRAFIICASRSFSRLLALHLYALKWQLATSPALSAPSYHFSFHNSIFADLSILYFRRPSLSSHLALFFPSTRSSFPCLRVAVGYKPGQICAQLPLSAQRFHLRRSLYSSIQPFFHRLRILLISRRLSLLTEHKTVSAQRLVDLSTSVGTKGECSLVRDFLLFLHYDQGKARTHVRMIMQ